MMLNETLGHNLIGAPYPAKNQQIWNISWNLWQVSFNDIALILGILQYLFVLGTLAHIRERVTAGAGACWEFRRWCRCH